MKKDIKDIFKEEVKIDEFLKRTIKEVLEPALDELVQNTSTPFDEIAKNAFYPVIEKMLLEKIDEVWAKI